MALLGLNLDQVMRFKEMLEEIKNRIKNDELYRNKIIFRECNEGIRVINIFKELLSFLRITNQIETDTNLYRVRYIGDENINYYSTREDLMYPPLKNTKLGRLNTTHKQILYTSFHEFTAIAESGIAENQRFQLTKFRTGNISFYKLGYFLNSYFQRPRDSKETNDFYRSIFGENFTDGFIMGLAAAENVLLSILNDKTEYSYYLSALLSEAIYEINPEIDAIMYNSIKDNTGINLAFFQESAEKLRIVYSCSNVLTRHYFDSFFNYKTTHEKIYHQEDDVSDFIAVKNNARYR